MNLGQSEEVKIFNHINNKFISFSSQLLVCFPSFDNFLCFILNNLIFAPVVMLVLIIKLIKDV